MLDATRWGSFFQLCSAMPLLVFGRYHRQPATFSRRKSGGRHDRPMWRNRGICLPRGLGDCRLVAQLPGRRLPAGDRPRLTTTGFRRRRSRIRGSHLDSSSCGVSITAGLSASSRDGLCGLAVIIGIASELATLTLVTWNAAIFIPVGRYLGIVWMILIAFNLPWPPRGVEAGSLNTSSGSEGSMSATE